MTAQRRAVGVVRVSQTAGRSGESFISPDMQTAAIEATCEAQGFELVRVLAPELNVSGGAALADRPSLSEAVRMCEAGEVEVVVGAYSSRLWRHGGEARQTVDRLEAGRRRSVGGRSTPHVLH